MPSFLTRTLLRGALVSLLSHCGPGANPGTSSSEVTAIRGIMDSYAAAFAAGDVETLAGHWSEDGVYQTTGGAQLTGREEIASALKDTLSQSQGTELVISLDSFESIDPKTGIGKGIALVYVAGLRPQHSNFTAEFEEEDGRWMITKITETELSAEAPASSEVNAALEPLAWLTGTWVDQGPDSSIYYFCAWSPDGSFLSRSYAVATSAGIHSAGHEVITWNGAETQFQSRVFDSTGVVIEAEWSQGEDPDTWIRSSHGTLEDGVPASAVQKIRKIDENSFGLQVVDQKRDGKSIPDLADSIVVRAHSEGK